MKQDSTTENPTYNELYQRQTGHVAKVHPEVQDITTYAFDLTNTRR